LSSFALLRGRMAFITDDFMDEIIGMMRAGRRSRDA